MAVDPQRVAQAVSQMLESEAARAIAIKAAEVLAIAVLAVIALWAAKGFIRGLALARVIDPGSVGYVYSLTRNILLVAAAMLMVYVATGSQLLMILVLIAVTATLFSGWDALANLIGYYVILGSRMVSKDEYIVLPNGIHGRVKEIRPFYIVLENRYGFYIVPNAQIVRSGKLTRKDMSYFRLSIRMWGITDHALIERMKENIREDLEAVLREMAYLSSTGYTILVDEISEDSVTFRVIFSLPDPEPRPEKVGDLIMRLSMLLKKRGISHSITFEEPEGYEQRWAAVE